MGKVPTFGCYKKHIQEKYMRRNSKSPAAIVLATFLSVLLSPSASAWQGYANFFTLDDSDCGSGSGAFCFGGPWGLADLKSTVETDGSLTLQPNFNTYDDNPGSDYWRDNGGAGPGGNKRAELNTFNADTILTGQESATFSGNVTAYTIDAAYTVVAFTKTFNSAGQFVTMETAAITAAGNFVVSASLEGLTGGSLQTGFAVTGVNAAGEGTANETALGSVKVATAPISYSYSSSSFEDATGIPVMPLWGLLGLAGLIGFMGYRRKQA